MSAKATIVKAAPVAKPPDMVHLEVTLEQAEVMALVFGFIGGHYKTTSRRHTDAVSGALRQIGIYGNTLDADKLLRRPASGIYFIDEDPGLA